MNTYQSVNYQDQAEDDFAAYPIERLAKLVTLAVMAMLISGCGVISQQLKASPAEQTAFIASDAALLMEVDRDAPFHLRKLSSTPEKLVKKNAIVVKPVTASFLKPLETDEKLSLNNIDREEAIEALQAFTQEAFEQVVKQDNSARFALVPESEESDNAAVLEIALVEATPTNVARNVAANGLSFFVPGGGMLALGSSATVAIEGKLKDSKTGEVLEVFADRESGQLAPLSLRDFSSYSHARKAIEDWAAQWLELHKNNGVRVADSSPVTLIPW